MKYFFIIIVSITLSKFSFADPDTPFKQATSVKYKLADELKNGVLKKVVVDYNDVVYVLTDKGLFYISGYEVVRDVRYTPLADKMPVDVTVQEGSGHLYYLYNDYVLTNGYAGVPYVSLPKNTFQKFAVAADGSMLLAGKNNIALYKSGKLQIIALPNDDIFFITVHKEIFYALSNNAVYKLSNDHLAAIHAGKGLQAMCFKANNIVLATSNGYYSVNNTSGDTTLPLQTKLPVININCLQTVNASIWAGTHDGAFKQDTGNKYRYYASKRWLDDNDVIDLAANSKDDVYVLTTHGLNRIEFLTETLQQKATLFQDNIRQRHIRYGFISNVTLTTPGDITTARMTDTDNDGLWSAFYLGSQSFRYAVTKDTMAKRYAWEAFEAFERIISVNPLKNFPARTFERKGYKVSDPAAWHDSQDSGWEWKGTTSSDEFVGYIFIAAVLHETVTKTPEEKKRVADFIDKILTHIISNNYYFIDANGKPTRWGRWNPEYINSFPKSISDRKLGSTHIIAGLQLGYALTRKAIYKTEAMKLMHQYGYLDNMKTSYKAIKATPNVISEGVDLGSGPWNHSDDEMAFLTYWVLYHYAFDKSLQQQYAAIIKDHFEIEKPERNALWSMITLGTAGVYDKASTLWYLREYPLDLIRWDVKNSQRTDIELLPENFRSQYTKELLPTSELPMHRHNANAFELDGGEGGTSELAGDEYLLPYWMARYLKVIK